MEEKVSGVTQKTEYEHRDASISGALPGLSGLKGFRCIQQNL